MQRLGWSQLELINMGERELTLALALGVADGLRSLVGVASLLGAVANTVGPVGLGAEAGLVTSRAGVLGVGDHVHVVDAQLLEWVSIVCKQRSTAMSRIWSKNVLRKNRGSGRWQRQQWRRGGPWTASS